MTTDFLNYTGMLEEAHRLIVRQALAHVAECGLPGEHHFYIAFRTDAPDVEMPEDLRAKHPEEMTIIIQHDFWGLEVEEEVFSVHLRFDGRPARLVIPYTAIVGFLDPSVQFGIQFDLEDENAEGKAPPAVTAPVGAGTPAMAPLERLTEIPAKAPESQAEAAKETGEVITLDKFRKK